MPANRPIHVGPYVDQNITTQGFVLQTLPLQTLVRKTPHDMRAHAAYTPADADYTPDNNDVFRYVRSHNKWVLGRSPYAVNGMANDINWTV